MLISHPRPAQRIELIVNDHYSVIPGNRDLGLRNLKLADFRHLVFFPHKFTFIRPHIGT